MRANIPKREFDELGEGLVISYLKRAGITKLPRCVDIEGLACSLGLTVTYAKFAEDDFDKIAFLANGYTPLKVFHPGQNKPVPVEELFPKGTIVLDERLRKPEESGRRRFTIAHEVAHFVIDRHCPAPAPQYQREYDSERDYSLEEFKTQFNIVEHSADALGAAILMPYFIVETALKEINNGEKIRICGDNVFPPQERIKVRKMAAQIGVSFTALLIRLRQFDMLEYCRLEDYLDKCVFSGGGA